MGWTFDTCTCRANTVRGNDRWKALDLATGRVFIGDGIARSIHEGMPLNKTQYTYAPPKWVDAAAEDLLAQRIGTREYTNTQKPHFLALPENPHSPALMGKTDYRHQILTQELASASIHGPTGETIDPQQLWVDSEHTIRDIEDSSTANTLGVAVLAVTANNRLMLGSRKSSLAVSGGRIDLTASGSCDYPSAEHGSLFEFVATEAARELSEETGVTAPDVQDFVVVTVSRQARRGGHLDVYLAVRLRVDSGALRANSDLAGHVDMGFVGSVSDLTLALSSAWTRGEVSGNVALMGALSAAVARESSVAPGRARDALTGLFG